MCIRDRNKLAESEIVRIGSEVEQVFAYVEQTLRDVAQDTRYGYDGTDFTIRVISPLAEGADRIVAEAALRARAEHAAKSSDCKFELNCIIPFAKEKYL